MTKMIVRRGRSSCRIIVSPAQATKPIAARQNPLQQMCRDDCLYREVIRRQKTSGLDLLALEGVESLMQ
jgi:hypothetical protein